jgi:hypothetical protein
MAQRVFCVAAVLALAIGCGRSDPPTAAQLVHMGQFDEAIGACTQAIRENPRDAEAYLYRGRAYHCRNAPGDLELAVADFTESIGLAPKDSEAYYSRALAHRDQGHAQDAQDDEKLARQLDPRLQEVYAQWPSAELPAAAKASEDEPSKDEPSGDEETSTLGRGIGYRAESRKERMNGSPAPGSAEPGPFGAATVPGGAGQRDRDKHLPLLMKPRYTLPSSDDKPLADEETPAKDLSPPRKADGVGLRRTGERSRGDTGRLRGSSTATPGPQSPLQAQSERPLQSPFPQRPLRPTGFVEEQPLPTTSRPQPRRSVNNPFSVPTVHPPGAYHDDFNP